MNKLTGLQAVRTQLAGARRSVLKRVLTPHRVPMDAATHDQHLLLAGHATLMLAELDDHIYYLPLLREACEAGIRGTVPEGFEEDGYEGWPEPATPEEPFDPYLAMELLLGTDSVFGVLALSEALLHYIERIPEQRRRSTVEVQDGEVLLTSDAQGQFRPMTPDEIGRLGDQVLADAFEETMFVQTYAQDLARVKALVADRGDLHEILALLS